MHAVDLAVGSHWPPFAFICYAKRCKKHYKINGFCNVETKVSVSLGTSGQKSKTCEFHLGFIVTVSRQWAHRGFGPRWPPFAPIGPPWPPMVPVGPHLPLFAIPKCAKSIIKLVVSDMLKQKCEFHCGLRVKKVKSVSFTLGFIVNVSEK